MDYQEALLKLRIHSAFPQEIIEDGSPKALSYDNSLIVCLQEIKKTGFKKDIDMHLDDILDCMRVINRYVNGENPSSSYASVKKIDDTLVLFVTSIINEGLWYYLNFSSSIRYDQKFCKNLAYVLLSIGCAWEGVLHGDIDDIYEYIRLESMSWDIME